MEIDQQEKITGRLCAMGRAKYYEMLVDGPGYAFIKDGFHWELDPVDQDQYGLTAEALNDCIEQLDKMGSAEELKKSQHVRQYQGWLNAGIVITSKVDPRIVCVVTLVDQEYENADVNLRWFVDLDRISNSARGPAERSVDAEELKSVERAQAMTKEIKESVDSLFEMPFQDKSKAKKVVGEAVDGWGFPLMEDVVDGVEGHVGVDALEKPHSEEGDKNREEVPGTAVKDLNTDPKGDGKDNKHVDGKGQGEVGGADKSTELPASDVKPGDPLADPKHMEEAKAKKEKEEKEAKEKAAKTEDVTTGVTGHVGVDAIEKPKSQEGDKDREEVDGEGKVKVKTVGADDKERKHVDGEGQGEVGGTDKLSDVAAAAVKPGTPESTPKVMSEELKKRRMAQYEAFKAKKAAALAESKKKEVTESVQHPLKVAEHLKKHMEEAHRATKKAHHLVEWAHEKMKKSAEHLPAPHLEALNAHHHKMEEAKNHMHEAKKCLGEVCESVSGIHMGMKKK